MRDTIEMALEAGFWQEHTNTYMCNKDDIKFFEAFVRADEREKIIKQVDWTALLRKGGLVTWGDASYLGERVVEAIRTKVNTK